MGLVDMESKCELTTKFKKIEHLNLISVIPLAFANNEKTKSFFNKLDF